MEESLKQQHLNRKTKDHVTHFGGYDGVQIFPIRNFDCGILARYESVDLPQGKIAITPSIDFFPVTECDIGFVCGRGKK